MEEKPNKDQALIEIEINYSKSFFYQNEKGLWLVLNVISFNMTDEPQLTGYAFLGGKLCPYIVTSAPNKGKLKWPLPPKTVNATVVDELFLMEPKEEREDTLVVTNFEENRDWHVGVGDKAVLVDKTRLQNKTKLE